VLFVQLLPKYIVCTWTMTMNAVIRPLLVASAEEGFSAQVATYV